MLPLSILGLLSLCISGMLYLRPANLEVLWRMLLRVKLLASSVDLVPRLKVSGRAYWSISRASQLTLVCVVSAGDHWVLSGVWRAPEGLRCLAA